EKELASQKDMDNAQFTFDSQNAQLKGAEALYDSRLAQLNVQEAQHKAAIAQAKQTDASLENANLDLKHTRIISPVDGIVVSRNVDVGQTVAASFQTPTLFTIAKDLTKMQVNTNVDEADIGQVFLGQEAAFTVDAYPEITFKGKVSQIRNAPIVVQNVVTYDCIIDVDNKELKLKPGMTANVSLLVSHKDNVLKIPNAALRFRPKDDGVQKTQKNGMGKKVWILKDGNLAQISVKTGISNGSFTEIIEGNLKEGDEIVVESVGKKSDTGKSSQQGIPRFIR
ncbi:MAG: efflux RND transporter periplasmic adaptor subunit, partial [Deltaproteobacteria bacterium]|nr:efflux RND transporter periplasmic adaptor subunit [Deltaproteobacteria bacterium]